MIPKGVDFSFYDQDKINLLMSHINSTSRESLDGLSPFDVIPEELKKASKKLGFDSIPADEINLTASLLLS